MGYKNKAKALRVLPSGKASKGVSYSSAGSGLLLDIDIRDTLSKEVRAHADFLGRLKMY